MKDHSQLAGEMIDKRESPYHVNDTMLFALGLGFGSDPTDKQELQFVYEENLKTLPTMCLVLGYAGFWMKDPKYGFDWQKVLHAEEEFTIHEPLPTSGRVVGETYIDEVIDRGADKGAFVYQRKELRDAATDRPFATVISNTLARGDGGFGGASTARPKPPPIPERAADATCDIPSLPQLALIYRLSGDMNPLHADPDVAASAGFERPILHGRCTLGIAQRAILRCCCDYQPEMFKSMRLRFSAPFLPGETLRTEIWRDDGGVHFRSSSVERNQVVLNNGYVTFK